MLLRKALRWPLRTGLSGRISGSFRSAALPITNRGMPSPCHCHHLSDCAGGAQGEVEPHGPLPPQLLGAALLPRDDEGRRREGFRVFSLDFAADFACHCPHTCHPHGPQEPHCDGESSAFSAILHIHALHMHESLGYTPLIIGGKKP